MPEALKFVHTRNDTTRDDLAFENIEINHYLTHTLQALRIDFFFLDNFDFPFYIRSKRMELLKGI